MDIWKVIYMETQFNINKLRRIINTEAKSFPRVKQREALRYFAKHYYGVRLVFHKKFDHPGIGYARSIFNPDGSVQFEIHIDEKSTHWISTFFHEIGHVYCRLTGRWKTYHEYGRFSKTGKYYYTVKTLRGRLRTGFRAELWVDEWGRKECQKWFPNYKYDKAYRSKGARKWLYDNYLYQFRERLDRMKEGKSQV